MEHHCKDCETSNGNDTCSLTGVLHTTGIECPSFRQKESEMFKVGDRVKVRAGGLKGSDGKITDVQVGVCRVALGGRGDFGILTQDLELVGTLTETGHAARMFIGHPEGVLELAENPEYYGQLAEEKNDVLGPITIRTFDSGATRDTDQGKLDYVKALSSIVIRRYVQYLDKHRLQSDGSYRDFDNWKKGIPVEAYISGNGRHFMDTWLLTEGYATSDNHGPVEIEDAICAQLFNLMGRLHEILKVKTITTRSGGVALRSPSGSGSVVDRTAPTEGGQ